MRPVKLEVQGLTSYRHPISIDFTDLDLFAVTGPTGSGKSSIIDAMTFALYGKVPRVGRNIKELISLGADRLKVAFYFTVGDTQYRIYRESARRGAGKPPQVERYDATTEDWRLEDPDRIKNVNEFIESLLLLDYEAFIRSVLLPQGEFQEFLAGDRDERRKVLDRLLQIGVFTLMGQRANAIAAQSGGEAESIRERLETELADATPDALADARTTLKVLEEQVCEIGRLRGELELASAASGRLSTARDRERRERAEAEQAAEQLREAQNTLAGGEEVLAELDIRLADARQQLETAGYDPDLRLKLVQARDHAQERDRLVGRLENIAAEREKAQEAVAAIKADLVTVAQTRASAQDSVKALTQVFDGVRRANAAVDLRTGLSPGDICPVCGETITALPSGSHGDLERARDDLDMATGALRKAESDLADVEKRGTRLEEQITALDGQRSELQGDIDRILARLEEAIGDRNTATAAIAEQLNAAESARKQAAELNQSISDLTEQRDKQVKAMTSAQQDAATLDAAVKAHERAAAEAAKEAADAETAVRSAASKHGWERVASALDQGTDAAALLRRDLEAARQEEGAVNQSIGSARERITRIEDNIALAGELREREKQHRDRATLASDLASMLRTNNFPAYIRDSAMRALAAGGSEWLQKLSGGRYDLRVEGQDFEVADLWNAGEERGVRTLSGGETFLASLALALALAEQLPGMTREGTASSLESLFIDEGFSNLDEETLNTVASALEVLGQDRRRLIGVVTHVPALADRMPARIVVHKTHSGSTVMVE